MKSEKADRQSRRTRRLIADALIALMVERRYNHITVQEIIDRADVGRSTFYAHYRDKEDVLTSEFERVLATLQQHLDLHGADGQLLFPSLSLFRHLQEQQHLYQALLRGHGLEVLYETGHRYLIANVERQLASLTTDGRATAVPLPLLADFVVGTFLGLLRWWMEHQRPYTPEQMHAIFEQLVLPGIQASIQHRESPM